MSKSVSSRLRRLDVAVFARREESLSGQDLVRDHARLVQELHEPAEDLLLDWSVQGSYRSAVDGLMQPSLHLRASTTVPLMCQRCMGPVEVALKVDRHFVFVADEETAAALDESSEDDVLALSPDFDLRSLIEDELLMALPLVPSHAQCPQPVKLSVSDPDFEASLQEKVNPFAVLAALKKDKRH